MFLLIINYFNSNINIFRYKGNKKIIPCIRNWFKLRLYICSHIKIIDNKSNLEKNNKLLNFNTKYVNKNYRITDIINDIKFKKEIDNKTILNYIIKADYITVNVGYNDIKSIINESEIYLYDDIDSIIIDLDELFKLLRMYSKEKIEFIKIETDSNIDDYVNSRVEKLCNKYNIIYIY